MREKIKLLSSAGTGHFYASNRVQARACPNCLKSKRRAGA